MCLTHTGFVIMTIIFLLLFVVIYIIGFLNGLEHKNKRKKTFFSLER